jgi:hypothetical protein
MRREICSQLWHRDVVSCLMERLSLSRRASVRPGVCLFVPRAEVLLDPTVGDTLALRCDERGFVHGTDLYGELRKLNLSRNRGRRRPRPMPPDWHQSLLECAASMSGVADHDPDDADD